MTKIKWNNKKIQIYELCIFGEQINTNIQKITWCIAYCYPFGELTEFYKTHLETRIVGSWTA